MDGSEVSAAYRAGRVGDIRRYCRPTLNTYHSISGFSSCGRIVQGIRRRSFAGAQIASYQGALGGVHRGVGRQRITLTVVRAWIMRLGSQYR
jgi:hypothetical protein